jgi:hypothetical protein
LGALRVIHHGWWWLFKRQQLMAKQMLQLLKS